VSATLTLTQATPAEMSPADGAALLCQVAGNVSKHAAEGTITVGPNTFAVLGICFNHETRAMEVIAEGGPAGRSFMTGPLLVDEPQTFSGRIVVNGGNGGRYNFELRSTQR
jgi:hypothetical protein